MASIEHFRKQAKSFLRWHRTGYHPVAAQIRALLPRFGHLTDHEILRQPFKLADAQELVARQAGFASWGALKQGIKMMEHAARPSPGKATLTSAEPELFVADFQAALAFYTAKLGFAVAFAYGNPPFYGQVRRDGACLNLRYVCDPVYVGDIREREDLLAAAINVDDVKQLFLEFQAAGVPFHQPLRLEPWGVRTFIVKDPDGNLALFAGSAE